MSTALLYLLAFLGIATIGSLVIRAALVLWVRRLHRLAAAAQVSLRATLAEASGAPIWADLASQPRYLPLTWRWVPGPNPLADERLAAVVAEWSR